MAKPKMSTNSISTKESLGAIVYKAVCDDCRKALTKVWRTESQAEADRDNHTNTPGFGHHVVHIVPKSRKKD